MNYSWKHLPSCVSTPGCWNATAETWTFRWNLN